jgi:hypothetical protein
MGGLSFRRNDFFAFVVAARSANVVRLYERTAVRAVHSVNNFEEVV